VQKQEYRGEAADIWALGVMMFVMLVGYFPYKGSSDEELYRKINLADYPGHDISVMRRAHHLISRMFAVDASQRITAPEVSGCVM
jgi:serine/threonine protein kinase